VVLGIGALQEGFFVVDCTTSGAWVHFSLQPAHFLVSGIRRLGYDSPSGTKWSQVVIQGRINKKTP
jgi:hypothetical protein